jgi:hypothetical protein
MGKSMANGGGFVTRRFVGFRRRFVGLMGWEEGGAKKIVKKVASWP